MNKNNKIAKIVIINPFEGKIDSLIRDVDISDCSSVSSAVSKAFPDIDVSCYAIDGKIVGGKESVPDGNFHRITSWNIPRGGVGKVFKFTEITIYKYIGHFISRTARSIRNFFNPKVEKYKKQIDDVSETQYGWDYDSENSDSEGSPIPVLYGERYVIPPVIQTHEYTEKNKNIIEQIYAIANGGGGFNDKINFSLDDNGFVVAQLAHASWRNYIDRKVAANLDNYNINRASGATCYINYDISTGTYDSETQYLTDGKISYTNSGIERPTDNVVIILPQNSYGLIIDVFSESRRKTENNVSKWLRGISSFKAYGKKTDNTWELIGQDCQATNYSYVYKKTEMNSASATESYYKAVKICDFVSEGTNGYENYEDGKLVEVKIYARTQAGTSVESSKISLGVTSGTLNENLPSTIKPEVWGSIEVSKTIDANDFVFRTTPDAYPDKIAINLSFPYGLYIIDDSTGDFGEKTVVIIAKYRIHGNSTWYNFDGFTNSGLSVAGSSTNKKSLYYEQDVSTLNGESYDINVKFSETYIDDKNNQSQLVWNGIEEGWNDSINYVKTSIACLKMVAGESLNGSIPQFKILASRLYVNVYDTILDEWCFADANNPAWVAYDLIVRPQFDDSNSFSTMSDSTLISETFSHDKIMFSDFKKWATFCNKKGITVSMYYDSTTTVKDALKYILEIGRASIVMHGNMIGVYVDCECDNPNNEGYPLSCFSFDDTNIVANSWGMNYCDTSEDPSRISVTYFDKRRDWNRFTVIVNTDDYENDKLEKSTSDITLYPCDDMTVAEKHARYILRSCLVRRSFSWKGDLDSIQLDIGDIVKVYDDYITITSISYDDDGYSVFSGEEYVPERFPSSENVSGTVGDGLYYLS